MQQMHDAVIVGGGPAGASCALWLARLGLAPLLVEASGRLGGLAVDNPFADDWIAVLPGMTGQQVAANIDTSVRAAGVPLRLDTRVTAVRPCKGGIEATLSDAKGDISLARGRTLVIASGVRAKGFPEHPPGSQWPGVLIGPGSPIVAQDYSGLSVAVDTAAHVEHMVFGALIV
ncbi:FAD-dependent oxidoreductase, partial [Achromobacter ruhlandii]|uniref:FAD-dependent oxidoreductase n=1 Tax=Achromobacter ruhlandii TaxID=72557 RepID=UPI001EED5B9E